jgi:ERCC4-related helicase
VLFATAIGSEGMDFPQCALVVALDRIQTSTAYIQHRGRARRPNGRFYFMLQDEQNELLQNQHHERVLKLLRCGDVDNPALRVLALHGMHHMPCVEHM